MWKTILNNINSLILASWKTIFFFALGALAGIFLLSCSVVQPAWDGVKNVTDTVVTTGEDVVISVYTGTKGLVVQGVEAVEGTVEGGYNLVADTLGLTDSDEE
tara:strand:- start:2127 stop:2435 length:309 start_codon:yes stop_codon:yes gene_type:complete